MPRGQRKRSIQSNDEYLQEEQMGQQINEDHGGSTVLQPSTGEDQLERTEDGVLHGIEQDNFEGTEDDIIDGTEQYNLQGHQAQDIEDETEEVITRGKTKLINVWGIPKGQRTVVNCNELGQPIGEEAGVLGKFLGMVERIEDLCSVSYKDWRLLIGKKERNNEQLNKERIIKQVKMRFLYPARMKKWILRTIGERWRQHKSNLKSIYFNASKSKEANIHNAPNGVVADQWIALVNNWMTSKSQGRI